MKKLVSLVYFCLAVLLLIQDSFSDDKTSAQKEEYAPAVIIEPLEKINSQEDNLEDWSEYEIYLLAKLAMAEAEGEPVETKVCVLQVVINRVNNSEFPNNIADVIYEKGQFAPIENGRFDEVEPNQECYEAVEIVCKSDCDMSNRAVYFETATDKPTWHSENLTFLFKSGNLKFYR